jgi:predicted nucleic acid-binding protein
MTSTPARLLQVVTNCMIAIDTNILIGACAEAKVDTLYTEDMGAPAVIDRITLINPFV